MSYFSAVLIAVFATIIPTILCWRSRPKLSSRTISIIIYSSIAVVFVVYSGLGILKYYALYFGLWDFGIYDSMLHNTISGKGFMYDFRGPFDHFSPAILLIAPLYWLFDSPFILIIFQSLLMCLAAVPLFFITQRYFRSSSVPILLTLMYLLNPYYSRIVLYDFHIECIFPLFFFSAWLAFIKRKMTLFCVIMVCIPMIKEDFIIPVAATGLLLLLKRKTRNYGAILIAAGILWGLLIIKIWFPMTIGANYQHYSRFPQILDGSFYGSVNNFLFVISRCFSVTSLMVLLSVLLPFALLPLLNWRVFVLLLCPVVFIQFCTTFPHQQYLMSHYSSAVIAVTPIAALYGLRTLRFWCKSRYRIIYKIWIRSALWLMVMVHICFCDLPFVTYHNYIHKYVPEYQIGLLSMPLHNFKLFDLEHAMLFHELRKQIPAGCSIATQNNLGVYFLRTNQVYRLPGPEKCDMYLFDARTSIGLDIDQVSRRFSELIRSKDYTCVFKQDGIFLFCRNKTGNVFQN